MAKYITDLDVSLNAAEEQELAARGFSKINVDLNLGAGGNKIFLWYMKGDIGAVTQVQFTFSDSMAVGLTGAGFQKIPKNLNEGAFGNDIYIWFIRGSTNVPIVEMDVTTRPDDEARKITLGWERSACDLNRYATGYRIHAWVKRESKTYISEVTATDSFGLDAELFKKGYIRIDENVNRETLGSPVFIWFYLTTDPKQALNSLGISTNNDEYQSLQQQEYTPVSVNLNEGNGGNLVYLWFKKDKVNRPIQAVSVLVNTAVDPFKKAGVQVIERNLNSGTFGAIVYLCYYP
ncbi:uncharacterized protein LOC115428015 [Sphaeramia orbicularis]|uniref:uncharacterized protein LOC115428015 n=1 Tax=Sphaeramia orbicularis TaxID=375764 RepID=UPI00117ED59C|nr:uncharacterized protein LOC115428015 [Sphaeramia orbicularis]